MGTSSMPRGLIRAGITPMFCGIQSWLEYTALYRRTMASSRGSPTSNCTVRMLLPGRDTE